MYAPSVEEQETYVQIEPSHLEQNQESYLISVHNDDLPIEQYQEDAKPSTSYTTLETPNATYSNFNENYPNTTVQQYSILQDSTSQGEAPHNEVLYRDCTLTGNYVQPSRTAQRLLYSTHEAFQSQPNTPQMNVYGNGNYHPYVTNGTLEVSSSFTGNNTGITTIPGDVQMNTYFPSTSTSQWSQMGEFDGKKRKMIFNCVLNS